MRKAGDVRQVSGTPVANDFANQGGTPLVIDITTGTLYYLNAANVVTAVPTGSGGSGGYPPELGFSRY